MKKNNSKCEVSVGYNLQHKTPKTSLKTKLKKTYIIKVSFSSTLDQPLTLTSINHK